MSGMGTEEWDEQEFIKYEKELDKQGYYIEHCGHCDRSNRHPSCRIIKKDDRLRSLPKH